VEDGSIYSPRTVSVGHISTGDTQWLWQAYLMSLLNARLTVDGVSIRPMVRADGEAVYRYLSTDPTISQWTRIPWPYTRAHLETFLNQIEVPATSGTDVVTAITLGSSDELVGCVGLHRIGAQWNRKSSFIPNELGYWLAEQHRGGGVMRRAASLMVRYALADLQLAVVNVQTKQGNAASQHVIRAIGFEPTETVDGADLVDDDVSHDRFAITAELWIAVHGELVSPSQFAL
jgi:RimJ/RimL family protein N-acetyltransferase